MVNTAPLPVGAVGRRDRAVHGLDEAARDREPEAGAGAHLVALLRAVELVEDAAPVGRRNAVALVEDLQRDRIPVAPALDRDRGVGRRIFGGVVEQIEQHLLEQHGVELQHRQVGGELQLDTLCCARILPARRSALPTISPRSCSAAFGTMAPDSSLVMSSRLAMKRLSRSDSSMMVASRSRFSRVVRLADEIAQRAGGAEHRGQRRLQIVRDRGQQRRAQALGLHRALDAVHVLDQLHALDRQRALVDQRVEQPPLVGRQQRPGLVAVDADDADRRRGRCASAGTAAWRRAACRSRGRPARSFSQAHFAAARSASSSMSSGG